MLKCDEPAWSESKIKSHSHTKANALMVSRSEKTRTIPKQNISSAVKKLSKVPNEIERQSASVYVMVGKMSSNCVIIRQTKNRKQKKQQKKGFSERLNVSIFYLLPCLQQAADTEAKSQSAVCCYVDLTPPRPLSL